MSESREKVLDLRSVFGMQATVTTPSAATDGAYVEMEIVLEPKGRTNLHYHPEQEETFDVLGGTLEVFRDGEWHKLSAGQSFTVPRGGTHAIRNATETPVRLTNVHRPALTFEGFLQTVDRLIRAGKIRKLTGLRSGIYMSMAAAGQGTAVQVRPPQALIRGLAFIGRRLGFKLE